MPYPYVTNDAVKAQVARMLQTAPDNLPPQWDGLVDQGVRSGAADVRQQLIGKGFTLDQIESWDQLSQYVLDQAVFWALTRAAVSGEQVSEAKLRTLDRRDELGQTGFLTNGSTILYPVAGESPVGGLSFGQSDYRERLEHTYGRQFGEHRRHRGYDDERGWG
jgi:hypothetical protein